MLQVRGHSGFAQECFTPIGIVRELEPKNLDRDHPVQSGVAGEKHNAHSPCSYPPDYLIAAIQCGENCGTFLVAVSRVSLASHVEEFPKRIPGARTQGWPGLLRDRSWLGKAFPASAMEQRSPRE